MSTSTTKTLELICEFFGVGEPKRFKPAGGYANKNFEVDTGKGDYFFKIVQEHSIENLRAEIQYTCHLASTGFPCPSPIKNKDGDSIFRCAGNSVVVLPFIKGKSHDTTTNERIAQLGRTLAQLHPIKCDTLQPRNTWWFAGFLDSALKLAKEHYEKDSLDHLEKKIAWLQQNQIDDLPQIIVHGDSWPGNAIFDGEQLVALIDWEETTIGYSIYVLAYLAIHGALLNGKFEPGLFNTLIHAYENIRKLSVAERQHFNKTVQRIACTNYLWLLLKSRDETTNPDNLWCTQWYRNLELEKLRLL